MQIFKVMWPRTNPYLNCFGLFACVVLIIHGYFFIIYNLHIFSITRQTSFSLSKSANFTEIILENTRSMIRLESWDHDFSQSGVNSIEDLVMESNGKPVRSLIISSWRSGSSFLGEIINAMPSNFYNYEPLMIYSASQVREPAKVINATRIIKDMLNCNFSTVRNGKTEYFAYVKIIKKVVNQIELNSRLWRQCSLREELCYEAPFVSRVCRLFPFQSMKLVRYRLPHAEPILNDDELNVRVVLLVRDPRAVMHSRRNFCNSPDCANPQVLCSDMLKDYKAAIEFIEKYPDKLMILRYEDLISNLKSSTRRLLKFLRLGRAPSVDKFLKTHTNVPDSKPFSTYRVSQDVPFKWKTKMNFTRVTQIQAVCVEAMSRWGYEPAHNASHLSSGAFQPLRPYRWSSLLAADRD